MEDPANEKASRELGMPVAAVYVATTRWRCLAALITALLEHTKLIGSLVLPQQAENAQVTSPKASA